MLALHVGTVVAAAVGLSAVSAADGPILDARNIIRIQDEPAGSPYDWGPSVMLDDGLYKMWWTRLGGINDRRLPFTALTSDSKGFSFTYPNYGDRIYYAESRDGKTWHITGDDYAGPIQDYGPDSAGPLLVLEPAESDQEFYHVGRPCVTKVDGTYYMYYETCSAYWARKDKAGNYTDLGEFQNQVFVAVSQDGKQWEKHGGNERPQPIVAAPESNLSPENWRYGLGQPSVYYENGRYIMHYVDSCTGPGDFMVRLEADNPLFTHPQLASRDLTGEAGLQGIPRGAVSRHAQTQMAYTDDALFLVRPAYGTGRLGILGTCTGVFGADARVLHPKDAFPQLRVPDPRGEDFNERLFPCFLTTPEGKLLPENGNAVIFYSSAKGFKDAIGTWDLFRCEVPLAQLRQAALGDRSAALPDFSQQPEQLLIQNALSKPDYDRLPRFFSSDPEYDAFVNEYFMRHLSVDGRGIYLGGGPIIGATDHMWVIEWDWWFFPWIDRGAMGLARQGGSPVDVIRTTLLNTPVDRFGYTFGGQMRGEQKDRTLSNLPLYGWPWPKYDRNYTVDRPTGWEFNNLEDGHRDEWTVEDMNLEPGYVDHCLVGKVTGPAPAIVSPRFDVDAFHVPILSIDIQYSGVEGNRCAALLDDFRVYWSTDKAPAFDEIRSVGVNFSALPPSDYPVHYGHLVTENYGRFPLYFPMHLHPEWGRGGNRITRLKIVPAGPGAEGISVSLNYVRATYDTRLTTTNATLINATDQFVLWSGDYDFLRRQMPRLRRALLFLNEHMKGKEKGLLSQEWFVGKDGVGGEVGRGVYGNYWDLLPGGVYDIESNINYYRALRRMAELERVIPARGIPVPEVSVDGPDNASHILYSETPQSLDALADRVKVNIERILWNPETQRFAKNLDVSGQLHDYGFLHFNLMALGFGVGAPEQREAIMSWLNGRVVHGDTATGADIYHWRFAPRTTTKHNEDWYYWAWIHDRGVNPDKTPYQFGNQMQDGGAVSFTSLFDLMARVSTGRQSEIDLAFERTREIQAWFNDVKAAGGEGRDFYRAYYEGHPERGLQQSPTPGGLGLDREFLSDGSLGTEFVFHAFLGVRCEKDGVLTIRPAVPSGLEYVGVENVCFRGNHLRIEAGKDYVSLEGSRIPSSTGLTAAVTFRNVPPGAAVTVDGKPADSAAKDETGAVTVTVDLRPVRIELR
jgi:hypothetical protein